MLTYLHHSDPTIAHYRNKQWSFLRGAVSTVDRPLLGWAGRFFLHNVSHDHVAHHLFSSIPFCKLVYAVLFPNYFSFFGLYSTPAQPSFSATDNQPYVTEAIKKVLKDDHNYDSTVCAYSSSVEKGTFFSSMCSFFVFIFAG